MLKVTLLVSYEARFASTAQYDQALNVGCSRKLLRKQKGLVCDEGYDEKEECVRPKSWRNPVPSQFQWKSAEDYLRLHVKNCS